MTVIEKIEETPFDAEADRRRIVAERRLRLERQKLEIEERKAETGLREREAQQKLEDANRRLEEARRLEQETAQRTKVEDCDDDYYLRYGVCVGYPAYGVRRYHHGPAGRSDIYREYYRENNNLYYKDPHTPGKPPTAPPPGKPPVKPAPGRRLRKAPPRRERRRKPQRRLFPRSQARRQPSRLPPIDLKTA